MKNFIRKACFSVIFTHKSTLQYKNTASNRV